MTTTTQPLGATGLEALGRLSAVAAQLDGSDLPVGARAKDLSEIERKCIDRRPLFQSSDDAVQTPAGFDRAAKACRDPLAVAIYADCAEARSHAAWLITVAGSSSKFAHAVFVSSVTSLAAGEKLIGDALARESTLIENLSQWEVWAHLHRSAQTLRLASSRRWRQLSAELEDLEQQTQAVELPSSRSAPELLAAQRVSLQDGLAEQLRLSERSLEKACAPRQGELYLEIRNHIETLTRLEWRDAGSQREARVPAGFEQELLARVHAIVVDRLAAAAGELNRHFEKEVEAVAQLFETGYGRRRAFSIHSIERFGLDEVVDAAVRLDREFRGRAPRRRFFQQLMEARRFLMIFFMMASAFGFSAVRGHVQWAAPISATLLAAGALATVRSTHREAAREQAQQLEKAREHLQSEVTRVLAEMQRGWQRFVKNHTAQQIAALLAQIETFHRQAEQERQKQTKRLGRRLRAQTADGQRRLREVDKMVADMTAAVAETRSRLDDATAGLRARLEAVVS